MRKWPVVGVLLAVLWLFVRGVELSARTIAGEAIIGLGIGFAVAYVLRPFYTESVDLGRLVGATPYAALYVAVFMRELLTANIEVAYRVLHPRMPIEPDVIAVPLRVETDAAITTIANSITLTPGTLTMDYDAPTNTLYVHGIAARDHEAVVSPIRTWEDYALMIFDEEATPSDPAPEPVPRGENDGE